MTATLVPVGNWGGQVSAPLNYAMGLWSVSAKKTGSEVTLQATAWMGQSAGKITPKSSTRRKIERNAQFGDFIPVWRKGREVPVFLGSKKDNPERYNEIKNNVTPIRLSGLAKQSWGWGVRKLGKSAGSMKFSDKKNVVKAGPVNEGANSGHEIANRLSYITKIMPEGYIAFAATMAANRMKKAAEVRMQNDLNRATRAAQRFGASITR